MPKFVNTLKNAELTSDPTADEGTFYYNSFTDELKLKNASSWAALGAATTTEMPTASVVPWIGSPSSVPSGWLLCNGAAVSRTTYADLFAITSTYFGTGDGSTTFNLPDFRGLSLVGAVSANAGIAVGNTAGGKVWSQGTSDPFSALTHSTETWSHTHTFSDNSQGSHTHAVDHSTTVDFDSATALAGHTHTYTAATSTTGHSHTIGTTGGGVGTLSLNSSADITFALNGHTHSVISVTGGNSHSHTVTEACTASSGHNHTYTGSTGSYTGTSGSSGAHTHGGTMAADSTANHNHSDHSANRARVWYVVKT
jgi:microcystin-dependent protein